MAAASLMPQARLGTVHVFGAGLAGLSAAVRLTEQGLPVILYEASGQAGGRCRSFEDKVLGCTIDNGNHLLLSGNRSAMAYLDLIGARNGLANPADAAFAFFHLGTGERWTVRPNTGRVPWWVLRPARRIAGTVPLDYFSGLRLARARPDQTVADVLDPTTTLFARFWEPLVLATLNTSPDRASAQLLWRALQESFARGGNHCRPMIARHGLSDALVEPALAYIQARGGEVRFNSRLRSVDVADGRIASGMVGETPLAFADGEQVVLALPPSRLGPLLPTLDLPADDAVIVNAHFRLPRALAAAGEPRFLGLLGGKAHWAFVRDDIVSITISAADRLGLADAPEDTLLADLWGEVQAAFGLGEEAYTAARLIRERRATFDQSPLGASKRPGADIGLSNLLLAGDFTDTGIPATIEGAIRSGEVAAATVAARLA
jgi:squalene-associated FAD-dependent desaturase